MADPDLQIRRGGGGGGRSPKICFQPFGPLGLTSLSVELGFWIPIAGGILDSTSKIFWDSGFHKLNLLDSSIRIPFQGAMLHLQRLLLLYVTSNSRKRYWDCKPPLLRLQRELLSAFCYDYRISLCGSCVRNSHLT